MRLGNDETGYGAVAQILHWGILALVVALYWIGWRMDDLPLGPEKIQTFNLHKSIGVTVLTLAVVRLAWRLFNPPPPLPAGMPVWEQRAARAAHWLLYGLLFAQPVIGILHSNAANFPVVVWGSVTLPTVIGPGEAVKEALATAHWIGAILLFLTVALHAAAALRHHVLLKDDILRRMLPLRRS